MKIFRAYSRQAGQVFQQIVQFILSRCLLLCLTFLSSFSGKFSRTFIFGVKCNVNRTGQGNKKPLYLGREYVGSCTWILAFQISCLTLVPKRMALMVEISGRAVVWGKSAGQIVHCLGSVGPCTYCTEVAFVLFKMSLMLYNLVT